MASKKLENKRFPMENIDFDLDPMWGIKVKYGLLSGHMEMIDDIDTPVIDSLKVVVALRTASCVESCSVDLTEMAQQRPKKYEHLIDDLKMIIYDELMGTAFVEPDYWERHK